MNRATAEKYGIQNPLDTEYVFWTTTTKFTDGPDSRFCVGFSILPLQESAHAITDMAFFPTSSYLKVLEMVRFPRVVFPKGDLHILWLENSQKKSVEELKLLTQKWMSNLI